MEQLRQQRGGAEQEKRRQEGVPLLCSGIGKKRNVKIIPVLYIYSHSNNSPIKGRLSVKYKPQNVNFTPVDI